MAWIRYTYEEAAGNIPPLKKPKRNEDSLQMLDRLGLNNFPDEVLKAAGFAGYDPGELFYGCLAEPWRGHPKHARFISDNIGEGFAFAVEMTESPAAALGRQGGLKGGKAKSERKTLSNRENAKRPRPERRINTLLKQAVIEEAEEGGYIAYVPSLPDANTQGGTIEEVTNNLRDAVRLILESNQ